MEIQELLRKRQEKFIETRSTIKQEVDAFLKSISQIDHTFFNGLQVPTGSTTEEVLPALWVEPFDEAEYNKELTQLNSFIAQVHILTDKCNQEALACLQQSL